MLADNACQQKELCRFFAKSLFCFSDIARKIIFKDVEKPLCDETKTALKCFAIRQPLTAPEITPLMMYFCAEM